MHTSVPLVRKPGSSGVPTASEALGRRWRDSLVFPRMPANPLVVVSVGERKVADDGVRQIIPFTYLHLAAEYGQLRSNSNRLAWSCLKLHCAGKPSFRGSPRRSFPPRQGWLPPGPPMPSRNRGLTDGGIGFGIDQFYFPAALNTL